MIKSISGSSTWLSCNTYQNPLYISPGSQSAGMVRYNPSLYRLEVYDGNAWLELGSTANVELTPPAHQALDWARKKMEAEQRAIDLAKTNPTIADALNNVKQAQEQLDIVMALTKVE